MAISENTEQVFNILAEAFKKNSVALVEVNERGTGKAFTVICMVAQSGTSYQFFPVAVMIEGYDPTERFESPEGSRVQDVEWPTIQGGNDAIH